MIEFIFYLSLGLLVYTYLIYPLLLKVLADRQGEKTTTDLPEQWPDVDVIIAAYNEESCIQARIENLLQQDYQGKLRILVGSDGSQDKTAQIIQSFSDERVVPFAFEQNRGKVSVLNELVSHSQADILVFSDANTHFTATTVTQLVCQLTPGDVGAVSGELILTSEDGHENLDGMYWKYEQFLKRHESKLGSLLGANGAIYAIKSDCYEPLPTDTIVDDFCIVMNVSKRNKRVVYDHQAQAFEEVAPTLKDEYGRRVRIGLGNYKALMANLWALSPSRGLLAFCFFSHKVLRWFAPHLLVATAFTNILLIGSPLFNLAFTAQLMFYGLAWFGHTQIKQGHKVNSLISIATFFASMNLALGQGFIKFVKGHKQGTWKRTSRQGDSQ